MEVELLTTHFSCARMFIYHSMSSRNLQGCLSRNRAPKISLTKTRFDICILGGSKHFETSLQRKSWEVHFLGIKTCQAGCRMLQHKLDEVRDMKMGTFPAFSYLIWRRIHEIIGEMAHSHCAKR